MNIMYELDFTGWMRTPDSLERVRTDKRYRRRLNKYRLVKGIRYNHSLRAIIRHLFDYIFNRDNF